MDAIHIAIALFIRDCLRRNVPVLLGLHVLQCSDEVKVVCTNCCAQTI
jgi:hypothetical protein